MLFFDRGCYRSVTYHFNQTYVSGGGPPGGSYFQPYLWNARTQTIENSHRTNNIMEGWNLGFASLVGYTHPSVRNLIKKSRADAHLSLTHVQHNRGDPFKKTKEGIRSFLDTNTKFMSAVRSAWLYDERFHRPFRR